MNARRHLPWLAGAAVGMAYLGTHSYFYNFDGVACAVAVELSDLRHLTHGNHLGYGVAGLAFFKLWQAFGYDGPALLTLQALDSLLGAASAGIFCALLLDLGIGPVAAALATAGLAFSYAWWFWSLEAQVYMLGCLFTALAAREALSPEPRPVRTGAWQALAILGHVGHLMLAPAAVYLLATSPSAAEPGARRRALVRYGLALCLPVLTAYLLAALFCVRPGSWDEVRVWLLGSAALTLDKSFVWFGGYSWGNLADWLRMSLRIFADAAEVPDSSRAAGWVLAACPVAAAAVAARRCWSRPARAALLWLAGYAALYTSWQPHTIVYRVSDLMPAWLLIALAASGRYPSGKAGPRAPMGGAWKPSWKVCLLAAWVGGAGVFNWKLLVQPWTQPSRNPAYQDALWAPSVVPENGWVAVLGLDQIYVPYFGGRKPLNIRYYQAHRPALAARLRALEAAGEPVFIASKTLELDGWGPFFQAYGMSEVGRSPEGAALYRVARR
ncbi:MAG: hypothetical protein HY748_13375 [Elusimicrobia bacterium]|nr:hypothetical protein [Elusimicrobiota bacterium]